MKRGRKLKPIGVVIFKEDLIELQKEMEKRPNGLMVIHFERIAKNQVSLDLARAEILSKEVGTFLKRKGL